MDTAKVVTKVLGTVALSATAVHLIPSTNAWVQLGAATTAAVTGMITMGVTTDLLWTEPQIPLGLAVGAVNFVRLTV